MANKPPIGNVSNPKTNQPTTKSFFGKLADIGSRAFGRVQTFFGYDIIKEIEGNEWNTMGIRGFQEARKWLASYVKDKDVHYKRKMLTQGRLYIFDYDKPKYEDTLPWFDTEPLVLSLGTVITKEGPRDIGLNLHLLPPKIRRIVMAQVFNMYKQKYTGQLYKRDQREVQVDWQKLVMPLEKYGIKFCIRMYIPKLRTHVIEFRYEDWKNAIYIQSKGLRKITLLKLEEEWKRFVNKPRNTSLPPIWSKS